MESRSLPEEFTALPEATQQRIREEGGEMVRFAYSHVFPLVVAPPVASRRLDLFRNGTAFFLRLGPKVFIVTADHVLRYYFDHRNDDLPHVFQARSAQLWPEERPGWRSDSLDIALIESTDDEARSIGARVVEPGDRWPPATPSHGSLVAFSGFPAVGREHPTPSKATHNALSAALVVSSLGENHFICELAREDLVSFYGPPPPTHRTPWGGMSGGPVFDVSDKGRPLVGVISEYLEEYELLRVSALCAIPRPLPLTALAPR